MNLINHEKKIGRSLQQHQREEEFEEIDDKNGHDYK